MHACLSSPAYFLRTYGQVYDATARSWTAFDLWPSQADVLARFERHPLTVVLKARQLGLSWLCCGWALWLMLFQPAATVLLFSQRDAEAIHLLAFRVRGMLDRLPAFLQSAVLVDNAHDLRLANGSSALAFPTTGGRSYTASLAIIDEADHAGDLDALLNAVKPTIDAGGRLILLSTADKSRPESAFKRIFRAAQGHENAYHPVFLPWAARPGRSGEWYAAQKADVLARTGALDDLYQEYPATITEALAARSLDRRFAAEWLSRCDGSGVGVVAVDGVGVGLKPTPTLPGLLTWGPVTIGVRYVIAADPAEGNPQSDESAACVLEERTGVQVAALGGRVEPAVFAAQLAALSGYYNGAPVLVERNNHGHAVLLWLREFASGVRLLNGLDGKPGWLETGRGKALACDAAGDALRAGAALVRDRVTLAQLASIEGSTLAAPVGQHDDRAIAFVLALAALRYCSVVPVVGRSIPPRDVLAEADSRNY
jgi:hypothetical protein